MEAEQMVNLLRRVRHDFANHLQVIGGYLELGWAEQAGAYVREITAGLNQERIIFEAVAPEYALYFYEQMVTVKDMGILLVYDDLDVKTPGCLMTTSEPARSIASLRQDLPSGEEDTILYVSIHEDETGIEMYFNCDRWVGQSRRTRINKE